MATQSLTVSLTSAMANQIATSNAGAYIVYFDPTSGLPTWTSLPGSTTGATAVTLSSIPFPFKGAKFYLVVQDTQGGTISSVSSMITDQAQIGYTGNPSTNAIALNYRFDSFEATFNGAGDVGNLTEIQGFGIPMELKVVYSSGGVTSSSTRGYGLSGGSYSSGAGGNSGIWNELNSAGAVVKYFTGTGGLAGQPLLAAGPSTVLTNSGTADSTWGTYTSADWNYYISQLISGGAMTDGNANQIRIAGYFQGSVDANHIYHNPGIYSYRVTYNSATSNIVLTPDASSQIKGAITLSVADLANSIYAQNGQMTVAGMTGSLTSSTQGVGWNYQWGAVLRDLETGFDAGYFGRLGSSLNSSVSGTINLNKEWNWDPTYAFQSNTTGTISASSSGGRNNLYDPYSKVFYDNSTTYGFPFTDNLTAAMNFGPLISLNTWAGQAADSQDITLTLFADNESPSADYTRWQIYNYTSGPYTTPVYNTDSTNLTLNFTAGTMALAMNTPVTLRFMNAAAPYNSVTMSSAGFYTMNSGGGGYTVTPNGGSTASAGLYQVTHLAFDAGVNWFQIDVGTGSAAKTYNLYMSAETSGGSAHLLNPGYISGGAYVQASAFAVDGLAQTTEGNDPTNKYTTTPQVNFFYGGTVTLDPSMMTQVVGSSIPGSATASNGNFLIPYAPILGGRSSPTSAFTGFYIPQNFTTSATTADLTPTAQTISSTNVFAGWYGADNSMVTSQAGTAIKNYYVGGYTNKIGGQNVAKLTLTGSNLPTVNHAALIMAADTDGQWTANAPIHFGTGSGSYVLVMNEYLAGDTAFASAATKPSAPLSFTIAGTADAVSSSGVTVTSSVSNTIFRAGATVSVTSGAFTNAVTLSSGTTGLVAGSATAYWTFISAGAQMVISSGGSTSGSVVVSNGAEYVLAGGVACGTDLSTHGHSRVASGAIVSGMYVSNSGSGWISGTAIGTTLAGGWQVISSGGVASNTVALSGGYAYISSGGIASGTTVSSGGTEYVDTGGIARSTLVTSNSTQVVSSGGTASGTILSAHGYARVSAGGTISGAVISASGSGFIQGTAISTTLSGGWQVVSSGGVASNTQLNAGGYEFVSSGGTASGAVVSTGAAEYVDSGGTLSGATLSGGQAIVSAGGIVSGTITFAGSGALVLYDSDSFSGTIAGLSDANETIHLRDMNFASMTHSYTSTGASAGTLTVTDGADTATLALIGQYTAASFHFAADSNGGTYLWDPPADHTPSGLVTSG